MNPGNCSGISGGQPADNRRIAGAGAGLIQIRGWCLTKMPAFKFQKAATDYVRLNVSKFVRGYADHRALNGSSETTLRNEAGRKWHERTTAQ